MSSTFYECTELVDVSLYDPSALTCSSGWQLVSEPTFNLITADQASDFIIAVALLWGLVKLFHFLFSLLGVTR